MSGGKIALTTPIADQVFSLPISILRRAAIFCATALSGMMLPAAMPALLAAEMSNEVAKLYESVSVNPPKNGSMTVCYGFVCRRRVQFDFTANDRKTLTGIMNAGKASPTAERAAVQRAVVWFDRRLGPMIGTNIRIAYADFRHKADATNYDCWDTTRNVTALLLTLTDWGLLRHHTVSDPRYRGNPLKLQTPHNTAVLMEKASRSEWVVDMWTVAYAQPPEVMTVAEWQSRN